ncbi:hypothetical protein [Occallatibacter riparius]|uniref:Uncharacterized protein n=1 Tax=Occallatibacter riparius TaxID=1002689 RepID=A0A9J7BZ17_9BACT|nr:hypothetical protein [Occallatibacter riparius]UWZ86941.1 hypothetical protein MOP44_13555 [Occallatibacter riparius]
MSRQYPANVVEIALKETIERVDRSRVSVTRTIELLNQCQQTIEQSYKLLDRSKRLVTDPFGRPWTDRREEA